MPLQTFPNIGPSYSVHKIPHFKTNIITYETGVEQRISRWATDRKRFKIHFDAIIKASADTILNFFIARKGAFEAFLWTNPEDSVQYTVRFDMDLMDLDIFTYKLYKIGEIELLEVVS